MHAFRLLRVLRMSARECAVYAAGAGKGKPAKLEAAPKPTDWAAAPTITLKFQQTQRKASAACKALPVLAPNDILASEAESLWQ